MNREKKQAKSREAAVRHARETAIARERWRAAKDIAKKHASGLQSSLSRTFSRKKTTLRTHEPSKGTESDAVTSKDSGENNNNNLTDMMRSLEENPEKGEGFNMEIGEKKKTKGRHAHTQSQIFKYAYGQIEKEKAMEQQNQNLTFSGVVSMATEDDIKQRPTIEISFKDLTLTLKGSKKKLLRSVTGKLMPGRVAAVMGPSGAGKTTFLSAIAGKATGCETTGMILINGKMEPIRAYKRIIGFVPQDDIVHGNLTVQENLWFNARCRYVNNVQYVYLHGPSLLINQIFVYHFRLNVLLRMHATSSGFLLTCQKLIRCLWSKELSSHWGCKPFATL
jgi:ABC-type glutathione transport system ATPase component